MSNTCSQISDGIRLIGCEIEAQYWYFIQLFPHALELSPPMIAELRDVTLFYIGGHSFVHSRCLLSLTMF